MSTTTLATTVLGSSRLLESGRLRGKRVGIVANPASIDQQFVHVVDRLVRADGVTLGAIFGPQHGFDADLQENMIETPHAESRAHRVKVYSLYSETREPTPAMLDGLDVLVVDLQDVGTRIYTFIYTMAYCLTGAAKAGIPVIVCDRPNPIGGVAVEGPMLERGFESFVGLYPIPMRHGLTIGELARLFNDTFGLGANVPMATGSYSDSIVAYANGKMVVLRVPYPIGFYHRGVDGRIDDAKTGWKGKGLWATYGAYTPWHYEGGKGTTSKAVHFQLRPDPLAK